MRKITGEQVLGQMCVNNIDERIVVDVKVMNNIFFIGLMPKLLVRNMPKLSLCINLGLPHIFVNNI